VGTTAAASESNGAVLKRDRILLQNIVEKDGRKQLATAWQYRTNGGVTVITEYETYYDPENQLTLF
jgi:hypothetical protein